MPTPQIKDERTYQALRREGNSEEKSARIANAAAASSRGEVGARGGHSPRYEDWAKADLVKRAPGNRDQGPFHDDQAAAHIGPPRPLAGTAGYLRAS